MPMGDMPRNTRVRDYLAELAGQLVDPANVYKSRARPLPVDPAAMMSPPYALIYTVDEDPAVATVVGALDRTVTFAVVFEQAGPDGALEDPLELLGADFERLFAADRKLGGLVIKSGLKSKSRRFQPDGDQVVGTLQTIVAVTYRTPHGQPEG
ncbi:hypothetical protein [Azospirillum sp. B4]|uniref:hypothetical protein n=1 Tax=Azospirillum sp. B4 TaxID=95605 RepID=UPI0003468742|nr:hypothetical protein [Azospirillum sp. B4]